jgi:hypothetical protein
MPLSFPTIECARAERDGGIEARDALDEALSVAIVGLTSEQADDLKLRSDAWWETWCWTSSTQRSKRSRNFIPTLRRGLPLRKRVRRLVAMRSNRLFNADAPRRSFASLRSSSPVAGQLRR